MDSAKALAFQGPDRQSTQGWEKVTGSLRLARIRQRWRPILFLTELLLAGSILRALVAAARCSSLDHKNDAGNQ